MPRRPRWYRPDFVQDSTEGRSCSTTSGIHAPSGDSWPIDHLTGGEPMVLMTRGLRAALDDSSSRRTGGAMALPLQSGE